MKAVINAHIYDFEHFDSDCFIIFNDRIIETGKMEFFHNAAAKYALRNEDITDAAEKLLMPGLAVCHTHIYSAFARGISLPFSPENFLELLEQLWWKIDSKIGGQAAFYSALICAGSFIKNGVTSVIDHHAGGREITGSLSELKNALVDEYGLRGMFCFETSDRFNIDECIRENSEFAAACIPGKFHSHFGMHASMTLSDATLEKIKKSLNGRPVHIHAAESVMDQDDCRKKYGMNVIERLDRHGLLTPNSLVVHGTHLSENEMDIIAERECSLVINPSSNMNNGVGLPDFRMLKKHGVRCLLGNDGISTGIASEWQPLVFGMHHRYSDPCSFGMNDLLEIINSGYDYFNEALGMKTGRITEGHEADMQLVDCEFFTPVDSANALGHLFFGEASSFRPSHVWISGEPKLRDYRLLADRNDVLSKSLEISRKIWDELLEKEL